ncbi:MAG: hypothetical protein ACOYVF_10735 [Candidatus Zixiibacteriota bacterium]
MSENPKKLYLDAYDHFNRGYFEDAFVLGLKCLESAPKNSYWHPGTMGLLCWAANFMEDNSNVEIYANKLIELDCGADKPWFDGLARFNLALKCCRNNRISEAKRYFTRASENYSAYTVDSDLPPESVMVHRFFIGLSHLAASGDPEPLKQLDRELETLNSDDEEMGQLRQAISLNLRYIDGENVRDEAVRAAEEGISRTFLAAILLGKYLSR